MSIHNIGFYEDLTKIIFELSSKTHLISSAVMVLKMESYTTYNFVHFTSNACLPIAKNECSFIKPILHVLPS